MSIESIMRQEFDKCHDMACQLFPAYAGRAKPRLTFTYKGRSNGVAYGDSKWTVALNAHNLAQNLDTMRNTVSHEIAHMVDYALRGRSGHDAFWRNIHRRLGGTGERCYNAEAAGIAVKAGRRTNWYEYICPKSGERNMVGPKYHARLRNGQTLSLRNNTSGTRILPEHFTGNSEVRG